MKINGYCLFSAWELITKQLSGNNGKKDIPITETIGAVSARSNGEQLDSPEENPGWKSEDL